MYTTTVTVTQVPPDTRYVLDLGALYAAADVTVNGQTAGHAIFSPYRVDVTGLPGGGRQSTSRLR